MSNFLAFEVLNIGFMRGLSCFSMGHFASKILWTKGGSLDLLEVKVLAFVSPDSHGLSNWYQAKPAS